jgi:uncharacterized protein YfdQ (DUF2303 family)
MLTPDNAQASAATLIALAGCALVPQAAGDHHYVMVPPNYSAKDITELVEKANATPNRKRGTAQLKSVASLLAYCKDQNAATTAIIYADPDATKITAVFNDHRGTYAGWRDHRAEYKAEYTPEFYKWLKASKVQMDQTTFAEFIEDNFADIAEPAAQTMLDVATTLQVKTDIQFRSAKRLQDGQVQLGYVETLDAKAGADGALTIPKEFKIGVRIFKNGAGYFIKARLKYRVGGGNGKFWFELDRPEVVIEDAFKGYVDTVTAESGYQVLLGVA